MDEIKVFINVDQWEVYLNSYYINDIFNNLFEQYQRDSENYGWFRDEVKVFVFEFVEKMVVQFLEWLFFMNQF